MKKEINGSVVVYLIAIFVMPIITFLGAVFLVEEVLSIADVIGLTSTDVTRVFMGEIVLFAICWGALFLSYILYKFGIKIAQIIIVLFAFAYLVLNAYFSVNTYASIANIINPIIVLSSSIYALIKPLPVETVEKRKTRVKNSIKNLKPSKSKNNK